MYYKDYRDKNRIDFLISTIDGNEDDDDEEEEEEDNEYDGDEYQEEDDRFNVIGICALTKIDFNQMDKKFESFGKKLLKSFNKRKHLFENWEIDLFYDSFSSLVLNNIGFSNSILFPNMDIQNISKKLQVYLIVNGKYFELLSDNLSKVNDIKFVFN